MEQRRASRRPRVLIIAMVVAVVFHGLVFLCFVLPSHLNPHSEGRQQTSVRRQPVRWSQPTYALPASDSGASSQTDGAPSVAIARRMPSASLVGPSARSDPKLRQPSGRETGDGPPSSQPNHPLGRILHYDSEPTVPAYQPVSADDDTAKSAERSTVLSAGPAKALRLFPAR